jgi:hypothetical protein
MRRGRGPDRHDAPIYTSAIAVLALLVSSLVTLSSCSPANPAASPSWRVVTSPNLGTGGSELHAIAAVSANDIWAVGGYRPTIPDQNPNLPFPPDQSQALVEHWNGKVWNYTSSLTFAPPEYSFSALAAVAALSTNDVWAVGSLTKSTIGHPQTLIEHWDGTGWNVTPSPSPESSHFSALSAVAAISADNIWAVGETITNPNDVSQTLIEHWNGSSWKVVFSPNKGGGGLLTGVAAVSATSIWAVGTYWVDSSAGPTSKQTLAEQWDGGVVCHLQPHRIRRQPGIHRQLPLRGRGDLCRRHLGGGSGRRLLPAYHWRLQDP